jgi:5-methylcytosine-specific restriction protein A
MPTRAPRTCTTMGCQGKATAGARSSKCDTCLGAADRPRPGSEGYDRGWAALSREVRQERPVCEHCGRRPSRHTDHKDGNHLNNDPSNLQALCVSCHSRKTAQRDGGFGNRQATTTEDDAPPY